MQKILSALLLLALVASPAMAQRNLGDVTVNAYNHTIPVRVSANRPDLDYLAHEAFDAHGRYRRPDTYADYDIRFSLVAPAEVRVDISKGFDRSPFFSQALQGTSARNALLRAADVAVEKTNGKGLRGFFATKLAFIGRRTGSDEVYVSDLFLGDIRRITRDNAAALSPRWSPDGTKIIYTSYYHSGFPDIFLMDLDANRRTTFESFKGLDSGARFSPDGSRVAMVLSGEGATQIYVSDAQGRRVSRRTMSDSIKASPCWSPDGSRIVFAASPGPQLYVIPAGGGGWPQRISHGLSRYCAEPDWSTANPNEIAYTVVTGGYQIAVLDLSTGQSRQVSHAPFDAIEPCWLADGRHLVYTARDRHDNTVLSILDTETGKSTAISQRFGPCKQASTWLR